MKAAFAALAVLTLGAAVPSKPADMTAVRADLRKLVAAQETYFVDHNGYSANLGALKFTPSEGVTIKLVETAQNAYSASGTLKGVDGASCVMFVGRVAAAPKTAKGQAATQEGAVVCDE